ncbi:hypothetical protein RCL1_009097 [Eukaryota sp. TZLM3-RCL]
MSLLNNFGDLFINHCDYFIKVEPVSGLLPMSKSKTCLHALRFNLFGIFGKALTTNSPVDIIPDSFIAAGEDIDRENPTETQIVDMDFI